MTFGAVLGIFERMKSKKIGRPKAPVTLEAVEYAEELIRLGASQASVFRVVRSLAPVRKWDVPSRLTLARVLADRQKDAESGQKQARTRP